MPEKNYTTKMSSDKNNLENKFDKTRFKKSTLFKFLSVLIILIILSAVYTAVNYVNSKKYMYTSEQLLRYEQSAPNLGHGEIIYADKEKFVYTHMSGLFVYSFKDGRLKWVYDLEKITGQSHNFDVVASDNGDKVWLGKSDKETEYVLNLKNGRVKKTAYENSKDVFVPDEDYLLHNDSLEWCAANSFMDDGVKYSLWAEGETNLSITVNKVYTDSKTYGKEMIFGEKYKSKDELKNKISSGMVPYEMKVIEGSNLVFNVNREVVMQIDSIVAQNEEKFVSSIPQFEADSYDVYIKRISGDEELFASIIVFITIGEEVREIAYGYMYRDEYEKAVNLLEDK